MFIDHRRPAHEVGRGWALARRLKGQTARDRETGVPAIGQALGAGPPPGDEADHGLKPRHILAAVAMRIKGSMSRGDLEGLLGRGASTWYTNVVLQTSGTAPGPAEIARNLKRGRRELFFGCLSVPLAGGRAEYRKLLIVADAGGMIVDAGGALDGSTPDMEAARIHLAGRGSYLARLCAVRAGEDPWIVRAGPGFEGIDGDLPGADVRIIPGGPGGLRPAEMAPIDGAMDRLGGFAMLAEPFDEASYDLDALVQHLIGPANGLTEEELAGAGEDAARAAEELIWRFFAVSGRTPPGRGGRMQDLVPPTADAGSGVPAARDYTAQAGAPGELRGGYDGTNKTALDAASGPTILALLGLEPGVDGDALLGGRPYKGSVLEPTAGGTILASIMYLAGSITEDEIGKLYGMQHDAVLGQFRRTMDRLYNAMTWKPESVMRELKKARPHRIPGIMTGGWLHLGCLDVPVISKDGGGGTKKAVVIADRTGQVTALDRSRDGDAVDMAAEYLAGRGRSLAQLLRSRAEDGWAVVVPDGLEGLAKKLPGITVLGARAVRDDPEFSGVWGVFDEPGRGEGLMDRTVGMFGDYNMLVQPYDEGLYSLDRALQVAAGLVNARAALMRGLIGLPD